MVCLCLEYFTLTAGRKSIVLLDHDQIDRTIKKYGVEKKIDCPKKGIFFIHLDTRGFIFTWYTHSLMFIALSRLKRFFIRITNEKDAY